MPGPAGRRSFSLAAVRSFAYEDTVFATDSPVRGATRSSLGGAIVPGKDHATPLALPIHSLLD
jgi:hypothetical protein